MLNFIKWPLAAAVLAGSLAAAPPMMAGDGDHDGKKIGHVFVIILENEGFNTTFGTTAQQNPATQYLSQTLPSQGVLLSQYYGTGHVSLDNYIAMISGQSSTVQTHVDCTFYDDFKLAGVTPDGQAIGTGCLPGPVQDSCRSTHSRRQDLERLHGRHGQKSETRADDLRSAA